MPNSSDPILNFQNIPLHYRGVNNHPFQQPQGSDAYHSRANLASFFKDEKNYSFQWLFLHSANSDAFDTILKDLPVGLIMRNMVNLARPVYTDFTETNGEKAFKRVSADFYRELFFQEKIFVSYDFFVNPGNFIIDGKDKPEELEYLAREGGFDIWVKLTGNEMDKDIGFMHVKTGISVKIPNWWEKMVMAMGSGDKLENFLNWFEYSVEYLANLKKIDKFSRLLVKRVRIEVSGKNTTEAINDIQESLGSIESTIAVSQKHNADVVAVEYATGDDLRALNETAFKILDRRAYELGRVSNTNPRGDRMTAGENYKDITSIANRQKSTLEQLEAFADKVEELFGVQLSFAVSGIPEKEMLTMENKTAPHPNTEGNSAMSAADATSTNV